MDSRRSKIKNWFYQEKFTFLLGSLFFYTIALPFIEKRSHDGLYADLFFLVVLLSSVFAVSVKKRDLVLILIITCLSIIMLCLNVFFEKGNILFIRAILNIVFNASLVFIITGYFYQAKQVSKNTISAALIAYVLLTLLWTNLYLLVEIMYPNSFTIPHEIIMEDPSILKYFSFVTITTLGFGDISPLSSQAQTLTVLEAFIGQMYLAVLIARLVAIHTSQTIEKP